MLKGVHHIGLATHDMDGTLEFYEKVLGFRARVCEMPNPKVGGTIRHAFLDMGRGQLLAFMEPRNVPGVPDDFDAGINRGLGIRGGMIHFAFWCDDEAELGHKQQELRALGVEVTDLVDHGWCKSIYFKDPNYIQLEYCCYSADLDESLVAERYSDAWTRVSKS